MNSFEIFSFSPQSVADNDLKEVEVLLNGQAPALEDIKGHLCHPLCECPQCSLLVAQTHIDPSLVTTYSRDHRGCTGELYFRNDNTGFLFSFLCMLWIEEKVPH